MIEEAGKAASAYLKPREEGKKSFDYGDELVTDVIKTLTKVGEYWMARAASARSRRRTGCSPGYLDLWAVQHEAHDGRAAPTRPPSPTRATSASPTRTGRNNQFFDFLKQFYLITSRWAEAMVDDAEGLDAHTRQKAAFYVKQIANALAPSNFVLTNPELLRETLASERRQPRARHAHARRGHQGRRRRPQDPPVGHVASSSSARTSPRRPARSSTRTTSASSSSTRRRPKRC